MAAGVPSPGGLSRTAWTLGALAAGLLLGILLHAPTRPWAESLTPILAPIGGLWAAALQMTVIPLVLTHTFVAILTAPGDRSIGVLGVKALLFFVTMLVGAALLTGRTRIPAAAESGGGRGRRDLERRPPRRPRRRPRQLLRARGHSLIATRVIARIRERFRLELPMRGLFEAPTVARLAESLVHLRSPSAETKLLPIVPRSRSLGER